MTADRWLTVSPYRSFPPQSGGGRRVYHINRGLARAGFEVELFAGSYVRRSEHRIGERPYRETIAPGLVEQRYANPLLMALNDTLRRSGRPELGASLLPKLALPAPRLTRALADHTVVMLEHPYWYDRIAGQMQAGHVLVLDAHNIESALYAELAGGGALDRALLRRLETIEGRAMRAAQAVFFCSDNDRDNACKRFGLNRAHTHIAPNGVDTREVVPGDAVARAAAKQELGLGERPVALFVGTDWRPNVEAVRRLFDIARALPEVTFVAAGSVARAFPGGGSPNLLLPGFVGSLAPWLTAADIALNPMLSGSGSNLKLFEYLAAGLPVVSTPFGLRGLEPDTRSAVVSIEIEGFATAVRALLADPALPQRREDARRLALPYDWDTIASRMAGAIRSLLR